jgi:hypothetical protein
VDLRPRASTATIKHAHDSSYPGGERFSAIHVETKLIYHLTGAPRQDSLDYLVGSGEQRRRDIEAEHLS